MKKPHAVHYILITASLCLKYDKAHSSLCYGLPIRPTGASALSILISFDRRRILSLCVYSQIQTENGNPCGDNCYSTFSKIEACGSPPWTSFHSTVPCTDTYRITTYSYPTNIGLQPYQYTIRPLAFYSYCVTADRALDIELDSRHENTRDFITKLQVLDSRFENTRISSLSL